MAISVVCDSCGKRLNVKDELVGKKVKCPGCKTPFTVSKVGGAGQTIRVKPKVVKEKGPKVAISWGFVSMIVGALLVVGLVLAWVFGPVRAKNQWDPMAEKAESDVRDVVERGLQYHLYTTGEWSPKSRGPAPAVHEVHMLWDLFVMGLPEKIRFKGTTVEGGYTGTYNTKTFEVEAELEMGGLVVPGSGEVTKHGTVQAKVHGWNKDGDFKVWVNGKQAEFPSTPTSKPAKKDQNLPVAPGL